ncbi:Putative ampG protein [Moritella viscosa]|nr:Putative ampG protein [Moritella viscosa]SHN97135.1 Putative ampG protein [Moritella viscosa]SHN97136.1 Putative ampG protein [Moritella viscosa]SHN97137.1 Putative ampG protein [Moritella viscosa]SHN97464.1 Putative ampG protein [Moritella viscosa]
MVFSTLSFWLREAGVDRASIGFFSWIALTYAFKWAWSPLIDQIQIPWLHNKLGRRRSWLLFTQVVIISMLMIMATQDPQQSVTLFIIASLGLAIASATQDVVVDAFRIESAGTRLQGAMAATYMTGYRIAMIVAGAGSLAIAAFYDNSAIYNAAAWQFAYACMALFMLFGIVATLLSKEPIAKHKIHHVHNISDFLMTGIVKPLTDLFQRYGKTCLLLLGIVITYRISDIVMGIMANPFYVDMGYSKAEVAAISKVFGVVMTLIGAGLGGLLVSSLGLLSTLLLGGVLSALTNILFHWMAGSAAITQVMTVLTLIVPDAWLQTQDPAQLLLTLVISADNLSAGIATCAFVVFLSRLTNTQFTATQYALFSSIMVLLPKFIAGFSGVAVDTWDYSAFFIGTAVLGIIPVAFIIVLVYMQITKRFKWIES